MAVNLPFLFLTLSAWIYMPYKLKKTAKVDKISPTLYMYSGHFICNKKRNYLAYKRPILPDLIVIVLYLSSHTLKLKL